MKFEIVSPIGSVAKGSCTQVVAPSIEGEIGILYDHQPILIGLKEGEIRVTDNSKVDKFKISGGFLAVDSNEVTMVVDKVVK